jgi:ABC-type branched-subunit amino acid transport system substrate-binding protein
MKKTILLITIIGISIFCSVLFAEVGVTDDQILVGSSLALGGPSSFLGTETLRGLMACINSVNEKGGINGRKIKVIAYDDGYEPLPCVKNTKKLIEDDKVFCLTCYVGTPTSAKAQPIWTNAKVPVVGFFTGAEVLRTPFNRYNIHIRASYYDEAAKAVDIFVKDLGLKRIAIFYQYDSFGEAVKKGTEIALQKYGLTPVAYGSFERNTLDIEDGLAKIKDSRPEAIVMVGTYSPLAKFVKEAKRAGLTKTIFYTVSFVGPEAFAKELGNESDNVIITTVVPPYETATPLPIVDEYLKALKKYFPDTKPSFVSLEGYINGRVLVEGLKRAGKDITREKFIDAIESIREDIGGVKVEYGPNDHVGISLLWVMQIKDGKWVEVKDTKALIK